MRYLKKISLMIMLCSWTVAFGQNGEALYKQCAGCHGSDGKNKAFGKSGIIAGKTVEELMERLQFYKEVDIKTHSTTLVMSKQVKNMNTQDLNDIAQYISKLPK